MADDDKNNNGEAQAGIADEPGERADEFFERLGVPASGYASTIESALEHFRDAKVDSEARTWVPIGPRNVGGAIRCIAQNPLQPDFFFAGSAQGGLWKSEDNGYSWRSVGELELTMPVGAVGIAPSNPQVMYVGTGEPIVSALSGTGLYRSEDGGASFKRVVGPAHTDDNGAANHYARIVVDPREPQRFWAATERGLWRSDPSGVLGIGGGFTLEALPGGKTISVTDFALAKNPNDANKYLLLAGVNGVGIFSATFDRSSGSTSGWTRAITRTRAPVPAPPPIALPAAGFGRIRLAFAGTDPGLGRPPFAYAIMEDLGAMGRVAAAPSPGNMRQKCPTFVYRSEDFGVSWDADAGSTAIEPPTSDKDGQAWYSLSIAGDPSDRTHVVVGYVDLHLSIDSGKTFVRILDWTTYDRGDHSQHADQHAIHFDLRNARNLWVCNDGGISFTANHTAPAVAAAVPPIAAWRKRSYGIGAAQFTAFATHPRFPFIFGGGMQDNGTFLSYGGPSWYRLDGGDGGQMAFDPNNPRQFFTSSQVGLDSVLVGSGVAFLYSSTLPDVDPPGNVMAPRRVTTPVAAPNPFTFPAANTSVFVGVMEGDPVVSGRLMVGRVGAGFYTVDGGLNLAPLTTPGFPAPVVPPQTTDEVSALAFAPGQPDLWLGTANGMIFTTAANPPAPPAAGPAWTQRTPAPAVNGRVSAIVVHPRDPNVVAAAIGNRLLLSHNRGVNWARINGDGKALPSCPVLSVVFHPTNPQVIFASTLVGVWVARNLPARNPAAAALAATIDAEWKTYSQGLPPIQVNDLEVTPIMNTLRCGTFGRGAFESDLGATSAGFQIPEVQLLIREQITDDARSYPNQFFDDPRLPPVVPAPADYNHTRALDIRIDSPSFIRSEAFAFGDEMDGVEFDETFVSDKPLAGDINHVYVQVHNRGFGVASNTKVSLYFAPATGTPLVATPLDPKINFPGEPAVDSPWKLAAPPQTLGGFKPGQPMVVRFEWTPPLELTDGVALLAVCSDDKDSLAAIPAGDPIAFVRGTPKAALRLTAINRDTAYIRDGVDDDGRPGGVAWGGHSPDVIVVQAAVANPDDPAGPFKELGDRRLGDRVKTGANIIYVRVFNRTRVAANAKVKVFMVPTADPARTAGWVQLPQGAPAEVVVNAIAPLGWKFATINWPAVADPEPANPGGFKAFTLLAMASVVDAAGAPLDPYPDNTGVADLDTFWRFLTGAPLANNVAARALRFEL